MGDYWQCYESLKSFLQNSNYTVKSGTVKNTKYIITNCFKTKDGRPITAFFTFLMNGLRIAIAVNVKVKKVNQELDVTVQVLNRDKNVQEHYEIVDGSLESSIVMNCSPAFNISLTSTDLLKCASIQANRMQILLDSTGA